MINDFIITEIKLMQRYVEMLYHLRGRKRKKKKDDAYRYDMTCDMPQITCHITTIIYGISCQSTAE